MGATAKDDKDNRIRRRKDERETVDYVDRNKRMTQGDERPSLPAVLVTVLASCQHKEQQRQRKEKKESLFESIFCCFPIRCALNQDNS